MEKPIIDVQNIAKLYRVGTLGTTTLRDTAERLFGRSRNGHAPPAAEPTWFRAEQAGPSPNTFWALKDVSLQVARGEIVGIIGGNGAGKSTLLKILSRITEPTRGRIVLRGRVASLLEVGTGFHSELSGRENIFLNGAILGMKKHEIRRKFDEIVEFAEVGNFIDTPVKRYSSGMYVRLAFAVAAHLEPEILIIDEVLAVGDVQFQKKCLGKMRDVSRTDGRTVLFVSHNIDAIQRLCTRCVLFEGGRAMDNPDKDSAIAHYLSATLSKAAPNQSIDLEQARRTGNSAARFASAKYRSTRQRPNAHSGAPLEITVEIVSDCAQNVSSLAVYLSAPAGAKLINADSFSLGTGVALKQGSNFFQFKIDELHLTQGTYIAGMWMARYEGGRTEVIDSIESAFEFEVMDFGKNGFGSTQPGFVPCRFGISEVSSG